ncbi:MAG: hypothetical protein AAF957_03495 [Planctomycetota bacterium]
MIPSRKRRALAVSLLVLPALACGSAEEASPDANSAQTPAADQAPPSSVSSPDEMPSDLPRFVAQEGWVNEPPANQMRLMQFRLPGGDSGDGEVAVASWPGGVGPLEANLDRWVAQVGMSTPAAQLPDEQRWAEEVRDFLVTTIYVKGPIAPMQGSGSDAGPIEDGAMIAAFVEKVGGTAVWTIKATGPAATIAKQEEAIRAFLRAL